MTIVPAFVVPQVNSCVASDILPDGFETRMINYAVIISGVATTLAYIIYSTSNGTYAEVGPTSIVPL